MSDIPEKRQKTLLYPLLFTPVLKDYIWGGRNLAAKLGRQLPPDKDIAESWEISAHPNGDVQISNGALRGKSLSQVTAELGEVLVGERGKWALERGKFPLLVKLLDATSMLSVQVHPDDAYARLNEGGELGKTEMWVVLHAEEDASIILGVKRGMTPEAFRTAVEDGTLGSQLHEISVEAGDFICVPSGSLHAILGGLLIAEIQQSSDVTYRVYDWNRVDSDGKSRPLHVKKALDVINFGQQEPTLSAGRLITTQDNGIERWELCRNEYFVVERVELPAGTTFDDKCDGESLEIWGSISGSATLSAGQEEIVLNAVTFTLLPARLGEYRIKTAQQPAQLLRAYLQ